MSARDLYYEEQRGYAAARHSAWVSDQQARRRQAEVPSPRDLYYAEQRAYAAARQAAWEREHQARQRQQHHRFVRACTVGSLRVIAGSAFVYAFFAWIVPGLSL